MRTMRKTSLFLSVLVALGGSFAVGRRVKAGNWPRFRGPNGTGVAADKGVPVSWTQKHGVLWTKALPGAGNSSPVVWGDRLFLQTATNHERQLLCLAVKDGTILWKQSVPGAPADKHPKNSFASSTPATDGERVYVLFWDGEKVFLAAYTLEGKQVWQRDLGSFTSQHGPGTSPVVYNGKVFLANDQDGTAAVIAIDAKTGTQAWCAERRAYRACYSTPLIRKSAHGKAELIVASTAGITSYDPNNGAKNWWWTWHFDGMALRTVASPVAGQGLIFANSGDGSGARHAIAVRPGGKGDVTKTNLAWERKRDFPYVPTMLLSRGYLFVVNDRGVASCRVARTGKTVWSERLGDSVTASPLLVNGKVYAVSEPGDVYVFPAAKEFKLLAKNSVGEQVYATPAVAAGKLFIRGEKHLFCIAGPSKK
jgi:outer membrane protein assembly factor BamB